MPTIVFIRHGETDWNAEGRFQGQRDIPLNARGRGQAQRNGRVLAEKMPQTVDFDFVASPLERTRQTMEIARGAMGLDPSAYRLDPILKEITFGRWEGMTTLEVKARFPAERRLRKVGRWNFNAHGGESYADLAHSMKSFLADLDPARPVLLVSHAGNIRVMAAMLAGVTREEAMTLSVPHDAVFRWDGSQLAWI
ncbi:MAG: histidine phosphatase family protein [Afipia sp.]|nr:histidine phosphatase family protein [Afipia sp.]